VHPAKRELTVCRRIIWLMGARIAFVLDAPTFAGNRRIMYGHNSVA